MTSSGLPKKNDRVWNCIRYCLFCPYVGSNISKHLRSHVDQHEIKEIISLEAKRKSLKDSSLSKEISTRLEILRNRGNHKHNKDVVAQKMGEIILAHRPVKYSEVDLGEYGPCPFCFLYFQQTHCLDIIYIFKELSFKIRKPYFCLDWDLPFNKI